MEIVNSQQFVDCMRPDIKQARDAAHHEHHHISVQKSKENINHNDHSQLDELWDSLMHFYEEHELDQAYAKSVEYS